MNSEYEQLLLESFIELDMQISNYNYNVQKYNTVVAQALWNTNTKSCVDTIETSMMLYEDIKYVFSIYDEKSIQTIQHNDIPKPDTFMRLIQQLEHLQKIKWLVRENIDYKAYDVKHPYEKNKLELYTKYISRLQNKKYIQSLPVIANPTT